MAPGAGAGDGFGVGAEEVEGGVAEVDGDAVVPGAVVASVVFGAGLAVGG